MADDWKNKECPFSGCADRQYQKELERSLTTMKTERDSYFKQLNNIKDSLSGRENALAGVLKDLLKGVKIGSDGKEVSMEDVEKKINEFANRMTDDKVSGIVKENLELTHQLHNTRLELEGVKGNLRETSAKMEALEKEREIQKEKDIRAIQETSKAQSQMKDMLKEKEDLEIELKRLSNHKEAIVRDIQAARSEVEPLIRKHQEAIDGIKKTEEEMEFYRKEFSHYHRYMPSKIGGWFGIMRSINRCMDALNKGRMDKAQKLWIKVQTKHLGLNDMEKRLIHREYDALMQRMEKSKGSFLPGGLPKPPAWNEEFRGLVEAPKP